MAITQISKITVRKGRKENLPQLAAGELGWAVDTQQLFIGNGSLSDGAPAAGNTEVLTEHSATPLNNGYASVTVATNVTEIATPFYQFAWADHPVGLLKFSVRRGSDYQLNEVIFAYNGGTVDITTRQVGLTSGVTVTAAVSTNFIVFKYVNSGAAATINFKREDYL